MAEVVTTEGVLGGKPRLKGHRIGVLHLCEFVQETSQEYAVDQFNLSLDDVQTALAYYEGHPDEMRELRQRQRELEEELKEIVLKPPADLRQ